MAIERMKAVWLFDPRQRDRELIDRLAALGMSHVTGSGIPPAEELERHGIEQVFPEVTQLEQRVQSLRDVLDALGPFAKKKRDLLADFIPTPLEVTAQEVRQVLDTLEIEALHESVKDEERNHNTITATLEKTRERRRALGILEGRHITILGTDAQRRVAAFLGTVSEQNARRLFAPGRFSETTALSIVARARRVALVQAACLAAERATVFAALREAGVEIIEPDTETVTAQEYLARLDAEIASLQEKLAASVARLREMAVAEHHRAQVACGYWEERLAIANSARHLARSKRLTILKGFVRESDLPEFRRRLAAEMPDVSMEVRDPEPTDTVPISLRNPKFLAPAQFLVSMFGLPQYFTFDPSPVIFFSFLIFFGFCFGDVVYGALLVTLGWMLARRYREYPNPKNFFLLLTYAGVPTIIVGALTGAWASDLPNYLGEGNALTRIAASMKIADPVDKALAILLLTLAMGMLNQFIGIIMLMVRNARQGDVKAAIFDGAFWLLLLPGFVILVSMLFVTIPPALKAVGWALFGLGGIGLMLTQGRAEKSFIGKVVVGVLSLYGVVGSYGITAFIGDTLSYSRLLALGLTTGIVGMSFNMIADMTRPITLAGVPIGIVIFIVVVIFGHLLNFTLSLLGGFVHSARLTFVEFFGRFYQGGAPRFAPLGTWQGRIRVTDRPTVWVEN